MQYRRLLALFFCCALAVEGCGGGGGGTEISVSDVGNVEGTVTDASTGTALSGVTVQVGDKSDVTGDNGVYSIQDIDVGTRTVTASITGYQNHNGTCEISKGTTVSHDIQLTANASSDTTPPTVSSTSPPNNGTDIAVNSAVTVTFSEAMDVSTITTSTFILKQGYTAVSGTATYNGTTATFTPSGNLSYNTSYTATITTGAKDTAGNAMISDYSWSFTTGAAPDTTPPTVSSTSPANNATGIAINSTITATFSENMDSSTVTTATFTLKQGTTAIAGAVTYNGTTATFTPSSSLSYSTTYTATITTGAKDSAGNAITSSYSWSFTTGAAPDTIPPTVSSTSPTSNATGIAINSAITATFSENMDSSTVTTATFTLKQGTTSIAGTVTYNGTTATFTPSANLSYSTTYTATITTGVKDAAGNAMTSDYSWSFTTGTAPDTTPPTVSSTSPTNNETGVVINSTLTATFSENMESSTVTTSTFTLKQGTTAISGTVTYNGTTATFTPSSNLSYSTTYTATITIGAKDSAGNAITSDYSWSFTTGTAPDTTPPTVSSTSPANNSTDVAVNTAITATFNETMDSSTVTTATFTLKQGTTPVSGTVTYTGTTATFTPSSNLADSTTYTATITAGVKDAAGNAMVSDYTWTFTTAHTPGAGFRMPDTNQTTSYTDTFGEDSDYTINPPSYTDNGDGTITDNVTGLVWQKQGDGTERKWSDATAYCDDLTLGAQTDWRLPSIIEMMTIVDYDTYSPAINTTFFPGTNSDYYWSSTEDPDGTTYAGFMHLASGEVGGQYKMTPNYVRCVRGGQNTPSLTDNGNGTVTDVGTLLTWQTAESSTLKWEEALSYCEELSLAGQTDWRLPNVKELASIVDHTRTYPAINTTLFPNTNSLYYWSSTARAEVPYSAWGVSFAAGSVWNMDANAYSLNVRCVRGGQ